MTTTTIVLADDHRIVLQGLKNLLEDEPGLKVVGEAASGAEAIELVERLKPDILISDLMMKGMSGIEVTREVQKRSPGTRTVILSMYDDIGFINHAMHEGARAYVLKGSGIDELIAAIRRVLAGETYIARRVEF